MATLRRSARALCAGGALGCGAFYVASERLRASPAYHWLADRVVTPLLQRLDAERAHTLSVKLCALGLSPIDGVPPSPVLRTRVWGRCFDHPLGLAAGYDKQAEAMEPLLQLGFAFVEVGGVTPRPQPGNERPRMFRLPLDRAVINRFGLNSAGHVDVEPRLRAWAAATREGAAAAGATRPRGAVGVNLAKNTCSDDATADYVEGVRTLGPHCDFIVLNVSCPNVKWTEALGKDQAQLRSLLRAVRQACDELQMAPHLPRPALLLKLGPDMDGPTKEAMARLALEGGVSGLVISNTSSARPASLIQHTTAQTLRGGLSGAPIKDAALQTLRDMYRLTGHGTLPIIGVGGISSGHDAYERVRSGASLLQIYTALAYEGPGLVPRIKHELAELLIRDGFDSVAAAVGVDADE